MENKISKKHVAHNFFKNKIPLDFNFWYEEQIL